MNRIEQAAPGVEPPAPPAWPAGHRVGGFELQGVAACGATGIVYRGWDFALARAVAVKEFLPAAIARRDGSGEVHPAGPGDAEAFARIRRAFVTDCQTLARCDHPSLARVLHLIEAHRTVYCVMPWYSGRPLLEVRPKIGHQVNEALLRSLLDDFLGALDAYHRLGGMHGGIRPSKLLLLDDDRGLLLGPGALGRATRHHARDAAKRPADSAFAAVEQTAAANGQLQGPWTDFYALAAIVRFWLTGALPPRPEHGPPEPLATTIGRSSAGQPAVRYSEGLLRAIDAALSVDIAERPQTAAQFRQWLLHAPPTTRQGLAPSLPIAKAPVPPAPTASAPPFVLPAADTRSAPTDVEGSTKSEDEIDPATVDAIRHVIDSIPDARGRAPRPPGRDPLPRTGVEPPRAAAAFVARPAPTASRGRPVSPRVWAAVGIAAIAIAAFAIAAWQVMPWLDRAAGVERIAQPEPSADPSGRVPSAPATEPAAAAPTVTEPSLPNDASSPVVVEPATQPTDQSSALATRTAPQPPTPRVAGSPSAPAAASPLALCGARTQFSLYRCMQHQCSLDTWKRHPQCLRLKATDTVE